MARKATRKKRIVDAFLVLGSQYYTFARYSAEQFYLPISVTLFHHAIEMLLKGFLASKGATLADLKRKGHNLETLWKEFRTFNTNHSLSKYDSAVRRLNQVELLRYPDTIIEQGFSLNIRLGTHVPLILPGAENMPRFDVDVWALDAIAITIFKACKMPTAPYFQNAPVELRNALPITLRPPTTGVQT